MKDVLLIWMIPNLFFIYYMCSDIINYGYADICCMSEGGPD